MFRSITKGDMGIIYTPEVLNVSVLAEFKETMKNIVDNNYTKIVLDMSETNVVDSSAFNAMISIHKDIKAKKGFLAVVSLRPNILNIFEITNMNLIFKIYESVDGIIR